jgi:hypothetical protein
MDADRLPRPEEVEAYHAHGAGCPDCAHWAKKEAERLELERMVDPPPSRQSWLWRLLFMCAVLTVPTAAWAIPSCYTIAPAPFIYHPYGVGISPAACEGPEDRFLLDGADFWGRVHLDLPAESLVVHRAEPEGIDAPTLHFYLRVLTAHEGNGDVNLVHPDIYMTQWLLGSEWLPDSARWWHEHVGILEWGPYVAPDDEPLAHSPEPATILLVGSTMLLIGWRVRRGRA